MTRPAKPAAQAVTIERAGLTVAQQANVLMQQALVAEQSGELQLALQRWQQVQALTPAQSRPYLAQARIWQLLGQNAQSVQVLQQALAQHIVDADIQLLLAQQAAARQQWQQVADLLPEQFVLAQQPEYYGLKATALQQLGQPQRSRELLAQNFVCQSAVDQNAASLQVAEAQVALAQARLSRMRIVAPFDGTVGITKVAVVSSK